MDAWRADSDSNVLNFLVSVTAQPAALSTIAELAPLLRQPSQSTPMAIYTYLQEQNKARQAMMDALRNEVVALNAVHNSLFSTACRLPDEIIAEILSHLPNHRYTPDLSNAMATCKQWREVGCHFARFWNDIPLHNLNLVSASLERSRALPLFLYLGMNRPLANAQRLAALLRPYVKRVQGIDIACSDVGALQALFSDLDVPAQTLETLRIQYTTIGTEEWMIDPPFRGSMPSLRLLALDKILLHPTPLWTTTIQELTMRNTLPSLPRMLSLLEQCPSLRTLLVDGFHTWPQEEGQPEPPMVKLPCLEMLDVRTEPLSASEDLLAHLVTPDKAILRLERDLLTDTRPIQLPDLRLCHHMPCVQMLKRVEVLWSDPSCIQIRGFRKVQVQEHTTPDVEIVIANPDDFWELPHPDQWYLDLKQVETFVIRLGGMGEDSVGWELWADWLRALPMLTTLRVIQSDGDSVLTLMDALVQMVPVIGAPMDLGFQPVTPRFCPWLHTVELFDFPWCRDVDTAMEDMIKKRQFFWPRAFRLLHASNARGGPSKVSKLGINDGSVPQAEMVMNLQE